MKELQGLGLKVDLLDNGDARDADRVIEKTTEEVERQRDDSVIYAQKDEIPPEEYVEEDEFVSEAPSDDEEDDQGDDEYEDYDVDEAGDIEDDITTDLGEDL